MEGPCRRRRVRHREMPTPQQTRHPAQSCSFAPGEHTPTGGSCLKAGRQLSALVRAWARPGPAAPSASAAVAKAPLPRRTAASRSRGTPPPGVSAGAAASLWPAGQEPPDCGRAERAGGGNAGGSWRSAAPRRDEGRGLVGSAPSDGAGAAAVLFSVCSCAVPRTLSLRPTRWRGGSRLHTAGLRAGHRIEATRHDHVGPRSRAAVPPTEGVDGPPGLHGGPTKPRRLFYVSGLCPRRERWRLPRCVPATGARGGGRAGHDKEGCDFG